MIKLFPCRKGAYGYHLANANTFAISNNSTYTGQRNHYVTQKVRRKLRFDMLRFLNQGDLNRRNCGNVTPMDRNTACAVQNHTVD